MVSTMNLPQYRILQSSIQSLAMSTFVEFYNGSIFAEVHGRNKKPSRTEVTICPVSPPLSKNVVYLTNDNYDLILLRYDTIENYTLNKGAFLTVLPTTRDVLNMFAPVGELTPKWLTSQELVWVIFSDLRQLDPDAKYVYDVTIKYAVGETFNIKIAYEKYSDLETDMRTYSRLFFDDTEVFCTGFKDNDELEPEDEEEEEEWL